MSEKSVTTCPTISAGELASRLADSVLLDVRSPIEYETEHVSGSINIPLDLIDSKSDQIPRNGQLFVICRTGIRAERAAYQLLGRGFHPNILAGGLVAWKKAGHHLVEGKRRISIERQIQLIVGVGVLTGVILGATRSPWFLVIPAFFGLGLTFAGLTGTCALGILLSKAPWNRLGSESSRACGSSK